MTPEADPRQPKPYDVDFKEKIVGEKFLRFCHLSTSIAR